MGSDFTGAHLFHLLVDVDRVDRLTKRFDPSGEALSFDKDDEDTLDFVVGAANLRAAAFDIESQTKFQVKGAFLGCSALPARTFSSREDEGTDARFLSF